MHPLTGSSSDSVDTIPSIDSQVQRPHLCFHVQDGKLADIRESLIPDWAVMTNQLEGGISSHLLKHEGQPVHVQTLMLQRQTPSETGCHVCMYARS